jgi:hypothetical protein
MCESCVLRRDNGVEELEEIRGKIRRGMRCGKSPDYFRRLLGSGCPSGRRCSRCRIQNNGKALNKGKGKCRRNACEEF